MGKGKDNQIEKGDVVIPLSPLTTVWRVGEVMEIEGQRCVVQELLEVGKGEIYPTTPRELVQVRDRIFEVEELLRGLPRIIIIQCEDGDIVIRNMTKGSVLEFLDRGILTQKDIEGAVKIPC